MMTLREDQADKLFVELPFALSIQSPLGSYSVILWIYCLDDGTWSAPWQTSFALLSLFPLNIFALDFTFQVFQIFKRFYSSLPASRWVQSRISLLQRAHRSILQGQTHNSASRAPNLPPALSGPDVAMSCVQPPSRPSLTYCGRQADMTPST
jgi:hypothetical protein